MRFGLIRLLLLAALAALTGCYTTHLINPAELRHLDGYDVHNERSVPTVVGVVGHSPGSRGGVYTATPIIEDVPVTDRPYRMLDSDGEPVDFNSKTELVLQLQDGTTTGGRFASIAVREGRFTGQRLDGADVIVPLRRVQTAQLDIFSRIKTAWAVTGITTAVGLAAALLILQAR